MFQKFITIPIYLLNPLNLVPSYTSYGVCTCTKNANVQFLGKPHVTLASLSQFYNYNLSPKAIKLGEQVIQVMGFIPVQECRCVVSWQAPRKPCITATIHKRLKHSNFIVSQGQLCRAISLSHYNSEFSYLYIVRKII